MKEWKYSDLYEGFIKVQDILGSWKLVPILKTSGHQVSLQFFEMVNLGCLLFRQKKLRRNYIMTEFLLRNFGIP